jgi:RimJ/RimL family protein N-acetyltransferase
METERLILRRWREGDLEPFARMNADPAVMEYFPSCLTRDESQLLIQRIEEKFEANGFGFWALQLKENNQFIGFAGLNIPDFETSFTPCVEIGWRLAKNYWDRGYATEAAKAALAYAFSAAKLGEILSWTFAGNMRSRKVMERIGMRYNPHEDFNHPTLSEGHPLSRHVLYRIKSPL